MLSILIPVLNFDLTQMVIDLLVSARLSKIEFEILIGDDGSNEEYKTIFGQLAANHEVRVLELKNNSGRSIVRNQLAKASSYDWLLFIDADSEIPDNSFISNYISGLSEDHLSICGGRIYQPEKPAEPQFYLHWKYGRTREVKSARYRNKKPWSGFQSNNFLIHKKIFESIAFSENISGYGHEDTLFGLEMKKRGLKVLHIDNPVFHIGMEDAHTFLDKAKNGVRNLKKVYELETATLSSHVRLLNTYLFCRALGMQRIFAFMFKKFGKNIEKNLLGNRPSLFLFDFYRLTYMFSLR